MNVVGEIEKLIRSGKTTNMHFRRKANFTLIGSTWDSLSSREKQAIAKKIKEMPEKDQIKAINAIAEGALRYGQNRLRTRRRIETKNIRKTRY